MARDPFAGTALDMTSEQPADPFAGTVLGEPQRVDPSANDSGDTSLASDVAASVGKGGSMLLKSVGDLYGLFSGDADNPVSEAGRAGIEKFQGMQSEGLRADEARRRAAIDAADGELAKAGVALWETLSDKDLFLNFAAEQLPMMLGPGVVGRGASVATRALGGSKAAGTAVGTGAGRVGESGLNAGDVAGGLYEELMQLPEEVWQKNEEYAAMIADGVSADQAKDQIAMNLARAAGGATSVVSLGSTVLPNAQTLERAIIGGGSKLPSGVMARFFGGAAGEATQEVIQEGGGQIIGNVAEQRVNPEAGTFEGVGEASGLGALGGGSIGGAAGALGGRQEEPDPIPEDEAQDALDELKSGVTESDFQDAEQRAGIDPATVFGPAEGEVQAQEAARAEGEEVVRQAADAAAAQVAAEGGDALDVVKTKIDAQRDGRAQLDTVVPRVTPEQRAAAEAEREAREAEDQIQRQLEERRKKVLDQRIAEEQKAAEREENVLAKAAADRQRARDAAGKGGATAEDLGVTFPQGDQGPAQTMPSQAEQVGDDEAVDDAIAEADARGDTQRGIRLRNMKRMQVGARAMRARGETENAARMQERADRIYRELIGERRVVPYEAPPPVEGELQQAERVEGAAPPRETQTIDQAPQARALPAGTGAINVPRTPEQEQRRQQARQADEVAREGVIPRGGRGRPQQPVVEERDSAIEEIDDEAYRVPPGAGSDLPTRPSPVGDDRARAGEDTDVEAGYQRFEEPTLGIPRQQMPQIKSTDRAALANFLGARGVTNRRETVAADTLKPTQTNYSPQKVAQARESNSRRAVLVARDGRIIDGHHQWLAAREDGADVEVIRLDTTAEDAISLALDFPSSTTAAEEDLDPDFSDAEADAPAGVEAPLDGMEPGRGGPSSPGRGVESKNSHGLEPSLRVRVGSRRALPKKARLVQKTNLLNAGPQLQEIDSILARHPNAENSPGAWARMYADALASDDVPVPPYGFIQDLRSGAVTERLRKLSEGQIADADHGFENGRRFREAYESGSLDEVTTGKLFLWSILSRGVSPYTQESLFIDAFHGIDPWVRKAADGDFNESDLDAYLEWVKTVSPKGSGQPGSGAAHNLSAFGRNWLMQMSKSTALASDAGPARQSKLKALHRMMADPNMTGQQIRREYHKLVAGSGIDNKVISFTLLVAGHDDVMVIDRVQVRQLWDDGRFNDRNLYDGRKENGNAVPGSALGGLTEGVRGLLTYEAIERALQDRVGEIYEELGRPEAASVGRYHWETWVAFSQQEASHGTLDAVLKDGIGEDLAIHGVTAKQGEYGAYEYGARYGVTADGKRFFDYTTPDGATHRFGLEEFRTFLADIKKPGTGVIKSGFKVTESGNAPWYTRQEVDQERLNELAAERAEKSERPRDGARAVQRSDEQADSDSQRAVERQQEGLTPDEFDALADRDPYQGTPTRPRTTERQRETGRAALSRLERLLQRGLPKRNAPDSEVRILGANIYSDFVETGTAALVGRDVTSPADLAALAQVYRDPRFETFRVFVTKGDKVVREIAISSRLPGSVQFGKDEIEARQNTVGAISAAMSETDADGYYVVHNHPNASPEPSAADIEATRWLARSRDGFKGHVVIDTNEYAVINESGEYSITQDERLQSRDFQVDPEAPSEFLGATTTKPSDRARLAKAMADDSRAVLFVTQDAKVGAVTSFPVDALEDLTLGTNRDNRRALAAFRRLARTTGTGIRAFVVYPRGKKPEPMVTRWLHGNFASGVYLADGTEVDTEGTAIYNDRLPFERATGVKRMEERLDGLPETVSVDGRDVAFEDFEPAKEAARKYMEDAGLEYVEPTEYAELDKRRAAKIAREFDLMEHAPNDPEVKAAYDAMIEETMEQYRAVLDTGLTVRFIKGDDPYGNPRNAVLDVIENNNFYVFSTKDGFGSSDNFDPSENPLLQETEFTTADGEPMLANDVFRVVHDYFGHVKNGVGFRARGEENAWQSHAAMYSPLARRAMTTETRGQNSWVNYGPYGEQNRSAGPADTVYADQKIGLLPIWVSEEGRLSERNRRSDRRYQEGLEGAVDEGRVQLTHFSRQPFDRTEPGLAGTGLDKLARRRWKPEVTYFGITQADENGYVRETGLGRVEQTFSLPAESLYPADSNPEGLWVRGDYAQSLQNMKEAGFSGFWSNNRALGKVAVVWDPLIRDEVPLSVEAPSKEEFDAPRRKPGSPEDAGAFFRDDVEFEAPVERARDRFIRGIQDKFEVLKRLQRNISKAGGKVTDDNNAYIAEELFHGKAENDLRIMQDVYVKSLANVLSKAGISQAELDDYLYARHAPERNAHIAAINEKFPDGGSGMTDKEAGEILARVKRSGKKKDYDAAAQIVYKMIAEQRDMIRRGGLEEDGTVALWEAKYENYVPLKGFAEDAKSYEARPRAGRGFDVRGKESRRALGRRSRAVSPSSEAIIDLTEKVVRRRKNEVGNALLRLVEDNPNRDYWEVFTDDNPDTQPTLVTRGGEEVVEDRPINMRGHPDYFMTKRGGKAHYIKLKDKRLLTAMQNLGINEMGPVIRGMATVNRWMSALNTSYSPEFMVSNFLRDLQTAMLNLQAEQSMGPEGKAYAARIAAKAASGAIPFGPAQRAIYATLRGKKLRGGAAKWQRVYEEFREAGAQTGYFDMKDIKDQQKAIRDMMAMTKDGLTPAKFKKWGLATAEWVEDLNRTVENTIRLTAYYHAREAGISKTRAASLAKNMTVNFNRRGEWGSTLNALYMFANASIQGTANFARTMGSLKPGEGPAWTRLNTAQKIAGGLMTMSAALAWMNYAFGGEDDDGRKWYDKVPDWVRERNLVIMKSVLGGEADGSYWTIPLPYGYNVFNVLGDGVASAGLGDESTAYHAGRVVLAALGSFSPIGFTMSEKSPVAGTIAKIITPSQVKPLVELPLNENFMNAQIRRQNLPFGDQLPNSALGRNSTPGLYKFVAQTLNNATGGSELRTGAVDINPDVISYFVDYYGGSAAGFAEKALDYVNRTARDTRVEPYRVPFLGRIDGRVLPYGDVDRFYQRRDEIAQILAEVKKHPDPKVREKSRERFAAEIGMAGLLDATENQMKLIRQQRQRVYENTELTMKQRQEKLDELAERQKAAVDRFNRRYDEAVDGGGQ